jgi:hypothetical protein
MQKTQEIVLSGFESDRELLSMHFSRLFGKIELTKEPPYVTEGNAAARLTMQNRDNGGGYHNHEFYILPGNPYLAKTDYSDAVGYAVDLYNAQAAPLWFALGCNYPHTAHDPRQFDVPRSYILGKCVLKSGMNRLRFTIDRTEVGYLTDLKAIKYFSFIFEGGASSDPPVAVYIDNFRAVTCDAAYAYNGPGFDFAATIDRSRFNNLNLFTK